MNKQYRSSHLMISDSGVVTVKATGKIAPMGTKGYLVSPGLVRTLKQMMDEIYPEVTHGDDTLEVVTVCHNEGKFRQAEDNPKHIGWYMVKGAKFNTLRAAQLGTGIPFKTISRWCSKGINDCSLIPR